VIFQFSMKKIITLTCFLLSFLVFFFTLNTLTSCKKQSTSCTADITVIDSASGPVSGATVKLYAPHGQVGATGTTNSSGNVSFTFSLPAIFNISATDVVRPNDTLKGSGIIQLQVGQTASTTVTVLR